jgi:hypothetical protein
MSKNGTSTNVEIWTDNGRMIFATLADVRRDVDGTLLVTLAPQAAERLERPLAEHCRNSGCHLNV